MALDPPATTPPAPPPPVIENVAPSSEVGDSNPKCGLGDVVLVPRVAGATRDLLLVPTTPAWTSGAALRASTVTEWGSGSGSGNCPTSSNNSGPGLWVAEWGVMENGESAVVRRSNESACDTTPSPASAWEPSEGERRWDLVKPRMVGHAQRSMARHGTIATRIKSQTHCTGVVCVCVCVCMFDGSDGVRIVAWVTTARPATNAHEQNKNKKKTPQDPPSTVPMHSRHRVLTQGPLPLPRSCTDR